MTEALNFREKAIADLEAMDCSQAPLMYFGLRYLIDKLRAAEVFVLPDHGELLDRSRPRPEVPGVMFRPPFPVVALEYTAQKPTRTDAFYTASRCSRRISLAWDWQDDLPSVIRHPSYGLLGPGAVVQSLAFYDEYQAWMPIMGAIHTPYDGQWVDQKPGASRFADTMREQGRISGNRGYTSTAIPMLAEPCAGVIRRLGRIELDDLIRADSMDEVNAYADLTIALGCKNVRFERQPAPEKLNRSRVKSGKPPLPDHHILVLGDGAGSGEAAFGTSASRRSHLRRGHIRRLSEGRITWVNQTMVHGRGGFAAKTYKMAGAR